MPTASGRTHVVVVGGGNAALCAAMAAHDLGARVTVLERAPRPFRGGNTRHTRNLRTLHRAADGFVTGPYLFEEFYEDLVGVSSAQLNPEMAGFTIRESESISPWMMQHGARWQAPLKGTLSLARTNHFFLGGGKAVLNAYYQTAGDMGIATHYDANVVGIRMDSDRCTGVEVAFGHADPVVLDADAVIVAAGGFEANRDWLREGWGEAADSLVVRGTRFNDGAMLRILMDSGALTVGDVAGAHAIAVDARAPRYDAGIISRLDAIPIGVVVNRAAQRFSDEGADLWPKRYASWGRLIADQPGSVAWAIYDSQVADSTIPGMFPPIQAGSISALASELGLSPQALEQTIGTFNAACEIGGSFDLASLDSCRTTNLTPPKSHWARPLDHPPYFGYPLRPGITFTYLGVAVDMTARVKTGTGVFSNIYAAGEIMAGNILSRGYLAGFGMTIGSVWGRIAGREAASGCR